MDPVAVRRWASTECSDGLSERPAAPDPGVQILNVLGDDELDLLPSVMDLATIEALDTTAASNGDAFNGGGAWRLCLGVRGLQGTPFDHALCPLTVELDSADLPGPSAFTLLLSADSWLQTARLSPRFCHVNVFPNGALGIKAVAFGFGSKELLRDPERLLREGCRHTKGGSTTEALAEAGPTSGARYIATYEGACEGRPENLDELLLTPAQLIVLVQHFLAVRDMEDPAQEPACSLLRRSVDRYVQRQREMALAYPQLEAPPPPPPAWASEFVVRCGRRIAPPVAAG